MVISQQNSPSMYNMQRTQPHSDGMGFVYPFIILHYFESVYGEVLGNSCNRSVEGGRRNV